MPEWLGYVKMDSENKTRVAGDQCHKESGYIQEILMVHLPYLCIEPVLTCRKRFTPLM